MIKKSLFFITLFFSVLCTFAQNDINIIPLPQKIERGNGTFLLDDKVTISTEGNKEWQAVASMLAEQIEKATGKKTKISKRKARIVFDKVNNKQLGNEGYTLIVNKDGVRITSNTAQGAFYGMQSLLQLLPPEIFSPQKVSGIKWEMPIVSIEDIPRFEYRGLHLDVARHFFPVSYVKRYIDLMAMHKKNQFHWHLTDDQGWRIEIKKYPLLTTVGGSRPQTNGDGKPHNGFYTQEEIKEVVAYAKARFINVIPEIEMPGHASAALAAYPRFGNDSTRKYQVSTNFGIMHDVFMPYEHTFSFLQDVLKEVIQLFPGKYIHIGGDECPKGQWNSSPFAKGLMQEKGLKNANELQSYFIKRIDTFLTKNNKKLIGWEEIAEGGLSDNAIVMSWKGEAAAYESIKKHHYSIMSPTQYCYLDYAQAEINEEPLAYPRLLKLDQVYGFNPAPASIDTSLIKYILGLQGNLWTEYCPTTHKVEYQVYPRACAIAEVAWTQQSNRNYNDFLKRWDYHKLRLDQLGVNYRGAPINDQFEYAYPPNSNKRNRK